MLSKITGREIADESRMRSISVLIRAIDLRWNWLGHILRMDERRTVRQVLLNCVKPTLESILGDLIDKDINKAISLAKDRIVADTRYARVAHTRYVRVLTGAYTNHRPVSSCGT